MQSPSDSVLVEAKTKNTAELNMLNTTVSSENERSNDLARPTSQGSNPESASSTNKPILIETKTVRLDYGELTAVNNVSLQVPAGEIYGLVGPNGAGKTSLLKMMANLIRPTYGELFICGIDLAENPREVYQHVGYMPDLSPVSPELKVWEFLEFFAAAYGIPPRERKARVDHCLELVDMTEHRNAYGKGLSRGMTQRVVLAKTLIPNPTVLLLDEPASGMDPIARINMKNILLRLGEQGVTTVVSSHILTELADMCTSVGIMNHGRLLKSGSIDTVLEDQPVSQIYIGTFNYNDSDKDIGNGSSDSISQPTLSLADTLSNHELVSAVERIENGFSIELSGNSEIEAALLRELIFAGFPINSFSKQAATMEDTLIGLVDSDSTDRESAASKERNDD